jgi:hypothetical protein
MSATPCSLTKLMFTKQEVCTHEGLIDFPELLASIVFGYKYALQQLQVEILAANPDNLKDIGHCFEKLEMVINRLIKYTAEKH